MSHYQQHVEIHTPQSERERLEERLGRWCAREPHRYWLEFEPDPQYTGRLAGQYTIKLCERGTDVAIVDADKWEQAMRRALDMVGA